MENVDSMQERVGNVREMDTLRKEPERNSRNRKHLATDECLCYKPIRRLGAPEERIRELEDLSTKTSQTAMQKD